MLIHPCGLWASWILLVTHFPSFDGRNMAEQRPIFTHQVCPPLSYSCRLIHREVSLALELCLPRQCQSNPDALCMVYLPTFG